MPTCVKPGQSTKKSIALIGASGYVGKAILHELINNGGFEITILSRSELVAPLSAAAEYRRVDYNSTDDLTAALEGHHAVVSALGKAEGTLAQLKLIDAAVKAGVEHFIPSEFGSDLQVPAIAAMPIYRAKVEVENHLKDAASSSAMAYSFVYTSILFEFGMQTGTILDLKAGKACLYDGGNHPFTTTRVTTVAKAVAAILSSPQTFRNTAVRIRDLAISQKRFLEIARESLPQRDWVEESQSTATLVSLAEQDIRAGHLGPKTFAAYAIRAAFGVDLQSNVGHDNGRLGVEEMTESELRSSLLEMYNSCQSEHGA